MASGSVASAVALMAVAMSLIPLGDTAGKLLIGDHGVSPYFVAWARFALGAVLVLPFVMRGSFAACFDWRVLLRGGFIIAGVAAILTALKTEPIANVFGAFFVGPILSYFLSALLLGERIGRAQTALLFIGFAGVLLVVRPGFGMTAGLGFAVLAGVFYSGYLVASRWIGGTFPAEQLLFVQLALGGVVLAPAMAAMPTLDGTVLWLLLLSGVASMAGNLLLILVYRQQPASRMAPFVYFQLVAATIYGVVVFGDVPDAVTLAGLVMLIASGFGSLALRPVEPIR